MNSENQYKKKQEKNKNILSKSLVLYLIHGGHKVLLSEGDGGTTCFSHFVYPPPASMSLKGSEGFTVL